MTAADRKLLESFERALAAARQVEAGGKRVAHSCDLGAPEDLGPLLAEPVDLLVCEVSHFEPQALFNFLSRHRLKCLALVHIARWQWEQREKIHEASRTRM